MNSACGNCTTKKTKPIPDDHPPQRAQHTQVKVDTPASSRKSLHVPLLPKSFENRSSCCSSKDQEFAPAAARKNHSTVRSNCCSFRIIIQQFAPTAAPSEDALLPTSPPKMQRGSSSTFQAPFGGRSFCSSVRVTSSQTPSRYLTRQ